MEYYFLTQNSLPDGFTDTQPYGAWMIIVAIVGMSVSVIVFGLLSFNLFLKIRSSYQKRKSPNSKQSAPQLKNAYLALFDKIEKSYISGELSAKDVYYDLSKATRSFASKKKGIELKNKTLREISTINGLGLLFETIDHLNDIQYANKEIVSDKANDNQAVLNSIEVCRTMIKRWA